MPIITLDGPHVKDLDKKREAASKIAATASELYGFNIESIIVLFKENVPENVAVGGKLIIDRE